MYEMMCQDRSGVLNKQEFIAALTSMELGWGPKRLRLLKRPLRKNEAKKRLKQRETCDFKSFLALEISFATSNSSLPVLTVIKREAHKAGDQRHHVPGGPGPRRQRLV